MNNNLELWDAFIKKNFSTIEYVVFKQIKNRLTHCELAYSNMLVYDDYTRLYVIYTKDILNDKPSKSARDYLEKDNKEFYFPNFKKNFIED